MTVTWHERLWSLSLLMLFIAVLGLAIALVGSKVADIRWKMSFVSLGGRAPVTIPLETVATMDDRAMLIPADMSYYFGVEEGFVCIKSDAGAHIKFIVSDGLTRLQAEPGVTFCKAPSFWQRFWWAIRL